VRAWGQEDQETEERREDDIGAVWERCGRGTERKRGSLEEGRKMGGA
jgi:hypothetical protein